MARKTIVHPAQNRHYSSNARGRHPRGCPTGVGLTRRHVSGPWGVKSITNSSRYNAQRDKKVSATTAFSELVRSASLLIGDFQYDSYVSASCRLGLLDYYWVPNSTWLAFLMVDCCALSLGSSLFSEILRTSSLLGGLTYEFSARLASTLWLGDVIQ